ncbi:MAG TPA: TetR/AcrR family transcriptional regulator [Acidimicrobiales bacterium]|jgi:AcrR family transcriptional regulator|nr:TetR/AcrR family transcriptional regulator [Acidimicrobiales bacterium]
MAEPGSDAEGDRKRSRKGVLTRARLIEAAKEVFEDDGFLDARISDITERAGLSYGAFYHYFDSKEEVFREVAAKVDERLSAPLDSIILAPSSDLAPEQRIRESLSRHLSSYRAEARIMGVVEQVSRYDDEVAAMRFGRHQEYNKRIGDSIRQLQQHGLADQALNPQLVAAMLGGMTQRFAEMWLVQGIVKPTFTEAVNQLTLVFVNALGLPNPSTPPGKRGRAKKSS